MFVYIINHWGEFHDFEGTIVVIARTDDECVYLCQRSNTKYCDIPFEYSTEKIRDELETYFSDSKFIRQSVLNAKKFRIAEKRWDYDRPFTMIEFLKEYGGLEEWYEAEFFQEKPRIV